MSNKQKTETKLSMSPNGFIDKREVPVQEKVVFTMPTEVRDPKFKPEGNFLLVDIIPIEEEVQDVIESTISNIQPNAQGVMERVDIKVEAVKAESGLFLPKETKKDRVQKAVVVAVGNGIDRSAGAIVEKADYEVGDIVAIKPTTMPPNPSMAFLIEIAGHPYMQIDRYLLAGKYEN